MIILKINLSRAAERGIRGQIAQGPWDLGSINKERNSILRMELIKHNRGMHNSKIVNIIGKHNSKIVNILGKHYSKIVRSIARK